MDYKLREVIETGVICILFPIFAVCLRFYARYRLKSFWWDDWLIIPAVLCNTGSVIAQFYSAARGKLGHKYTSTILPPDTPGGWPRNDPITLNYEQAKYAITILATLTLSISKISVLLMYRRIFARRKWFSHVTTVVFTRYNSGFSNSLFMGGCFHFRIHLPFYIALPSSVIATDFLVLSLPIPVVWGLQLPVKQRLAVVGMFLLGTVVCAAGVTRFIVFQASMKTWANNHQTYDCANAIMWTNVEAFLAIVSACLPTFRPLFKSLKETTIDSYNRAGETNRPSSSHSLHKLTRSNDDS
ncbi:hypothetical protein HYALB_00004142 [Hymenoscyphus albidus]|uniref:Rhodopsin domain-containing protein n=1 Tax=Hymenoscyphus albidus TaxID=595503 RepID=A0A9N9Q5J0_9HELO|nr:hypothetical protein HYALB_00004142 [Hymenoscyphus albidus]